MRRAREHLFILYRGSSELDGVQSRGAGWHSRTEGEPARPKGLILLARELSRGDLLTKGGVSYLHDGQRLARLPTFGAPEVVEHLSHYTKQWCLGFRPRQDSPSAWYDLWQDQSSEAPGMARLAAGLEVLAPALMRATCACAETVLKYLSEEQPQYRRAVRMARAWALGLATEAQVEETSEAVAALDGGGVKPSALGREAPFLDDLQSAANVFYFLTQHMEASHHAVQAVSGVFLVGTASSRAIRRSLAYLVRAVIPAWVVCEAISRRRR